ncbi:MAG: MMPL family transporter [Pseudomonas sp.]|uniref:MMPL family transporter n=1 Tax=Pseudomonas sp. TaxID=306 RepID=UPI00272190CF|nr:MMPL family transporter [Pseudomonas sp.]MDO8403131.1 MMPL family transporter [Pseudomonas sp.]
MLRQLSTTCVRHRRVVVFAWLLLAIGAVVAAGRFGGAYAENGRLPGTDSDRAYELLAAAAPADPNVAGDAAQLVFADPAGVAAAAPRIDAFLAEVAALDGVVTAPGSVAELMVSDDGTIATGQISLRRADDAVTQRVQQEMDALNAGPTQVAAAGWRFQNGGVPASEGFGLLAAAVILLVAFGSVVAMGLPIMAAMAGIVVGLAGVQLWAAVVETPAFTPQVASMIGIGVGIDYALFIVTAYREALGTGRSVEQAVGDAMATAGRAVVFAGVTVMISLLGMLLMGMSFLNGLALGTASAVLVAVLAAATLLPALLGMVGHRLDRLSIHRHTRRTGESVWHRWSRFVQRRAAVCAVGGFALMVALALPAFSMRFASADAGNDPAGSTTRVAYDRLADGFGPGFNGPLLVVARTAGDHTAVDRLAAELQGVPGVAAIAGVETAPAGDVALITLIPTTGPQDEATAGLVHRLRDTIRAGDITAHVGGQTAGDVDFSALMSSRLPLFIGAVLVLSFVLLMMVFRSVLVPLKAVVLNLLSIGAAYGVLVAVFQWGWLGWMIGVHEGAPIEPWAPMMLFAIVFGLSMDYEVFLLSSVKQRVDAGEPNSHAVVEGLASTARVITAAAAIMVCVFGSFVVGDLRAIKLIGLGLAVAVLLDASVVRMVLVPSTMELLGERNWWWPRRRARRAALATHAATPAEVL